MSENSLEERTVEVSGIPNEVEDEFLGLFFENKRRSGGGVLASLHRQGSRAVLIFEDAEVAKRVLSRGTHMLHNAKLTVRKPTPKDPGKVLLHGMNASTAKEVMELFVENVTKLDSTEYLMYPSPGRDMFLVQFQQPLSEQEFKRLADKVRKRLLDGARIEAEQVERTDSVIVEGLRSTTTEDMLALYFENKRGGGEEVRDVTMVADGMARVTFEDWEAVDRILQRSHKLDGRDLSLRPYFDFLLPGESPASPSTPNVKLNLLQRAWNRKGCWPPTLCQIAQSLSLHSPSAWSSRPQACSSPCFATSPYPLPQNEWPKFLSSLSLCSVKVSEQGDEINVQESVITMEPGMLRYLQTHCHMLLADMNQVTILPLEGEDITGLRVCVCKV
ncbi:PAR10 polymerase, partial [Polyodon spathula]|nr:PAR10 polymerase [Polyodon spathula]